MLQLLFLAAVAVALPAPEAEPQMWAGHPLTYATPYITYHAPTCTTEFEEVKGQSCQTKPVTECRDVEVPSHKIVVENVCQNVTTAECSGDAHHGVNTLPAAIGYAGYGYNGFYGKREAEAEADPQLLHAVPYHTCVNAIKEVCYPIQKVEETTITESSCLIKGEVECVEVTVATIPRVTCTHEEHTKPAGAVEVEA